MHPAKFYKANEGGVCECVLCPHHCRIQPGHSGLCLCRKNIEGELFSLTYGEVCSVSLDPVEKKPLYHFMPGKPILSVGSWGCNFKCSFCQNWEISQQEVPTRRLPPEELGKIAGRDGSIGVAYTYNEPFINFEYVADSCRAVHAAGLKNVLVSNGYYSPDALQELLPLVDAFNIDLKAFDEAFYKRLCKGSLQPVLESIQTVAESGAHLELTTLLIPGENDDPARLKEQAEWIADNCGADTPLHVSAYFPRYNLQAQPTDSADLLKAAEIFSKRLSNVYLGNLSMPGCCDSKCGGCGALLVKRDGYETRVCGLDKSGKCANCGSDNGFVIG